MKRTGTKTTAEVHEGKLSPIDVAGKVDGDLEKRNFVARYVKDGRVVAAAGWKRDEEMARLLEQADQGIDLQQRNPR